MTGHHLFRTMVAAAAATMALTLATQTRAESGEESVYMVSAVATTAAIPDKAGEASGGAAEPLVLTAPELGGRGSKRAQALALDFARAAAVRPLIVRFASENGVPVDLADAIVRVESRYNVRARNGANVGLTQINARTAQSLGYQGSAAGLLDAETNLRYGIKYLGQAYKLASGDTCGTILRYQAGHRAQTMTSAARSYCARVKTIIARAP